MASAFEVYIEDFTNECCLKNTIMAKDAVNLPHGVRSSLNIYTKKDKNCFSPINLCDEGWRAVYKTMVSEATDKLNTPKIANIKALFSQYIGILDEKIEAIESTLII